MAEQYWEKYTDGNGIEWGTQLIDYDDVDNAGARGNLSVAIGKANLAYGEMSFAAGCRTKALGAASSSDGIHTVAGGRASHAGGYYTKTTNDAEFAVGRFNESTSDLTIFSVGNGEDDETRSNALEVTLDDKTIVKKLQVLNPGDTTAVAGLGLDEDNNVVLIEGSTSGVNDGKFTITAAGTTISEFTANQEGDTTLDISTDDTLTLTQTQSGILLGVKYYQLIQPLTILANGYDVLEYNPILSETASSLNVVLGEGIQLTYDEGVITISAHLNTPNTPNDGKLFVLAGGVLNQVFTANQSGSTTLSIVGSGGTTVSQSGNTLTISTDEVSEVNDGKLLVLLNNSVIKEFSANQSENTVLLIEIPGLYIDQDGTLKSNIESANNSKIQVYYDDLLYTELYLNSPYNLSLNLPKILDAEILVTAQNRILGSFSLNLEEDATIDLSELLPTGVGSPFEEVNGNVRRINSDESVWGNNNISFSTYSSTNTSGFLNPDVLIANSILGVSAKVGDLLAYTYDGNTYSTEIVQTGDNEVYMESPIIPDANVYNAIISELASGAKITVNIILRNYLGGKLSALLGEYNKLYDGEDSLIGGDNNTIIRANSSIIAGSSNVVEHSDSESEAFIENSLLIGSNNDVYEATSSFIAGEYNTIEEILRSVIGGDSNIINRAYDSLIVGTSNNIENIWGAIIGGDHNIATNVSHVLIVGESLTVTNTDESALGKCNQSIEDLTLFSIGNGTEDNRKNALEVTLDDTTIIRKGKILEPLTGTPSTYLALDSNNNIISAAGGTTIETGHIYNSNSDSLAEGVNLQYTINTASGVRSHAEGSNTTASGVGSHAEGINTTASGNYSHAEGQITIASGKASHAEGCGLLSNEPIIQFTCSKIGQGEKDTIAAATGITFIYCDHNSGINNIYGSQGYIYRDANCTDFVSEVTICRYYSISTYNGSYFNIKSGELNDNDIYYWKRIYGAEGDYSHTEGVQTLASGLASHAKGSDTTALGTNSYAEGYGTIASGDYSHAEGWMTTASGQQSHAEGVSTIASGDHSHAEGEYTRASGYKSHAEGTGTDASGLASHAEGLGTEAYGQASHAEGAGTITNNDGEHACGRFNNSHSSTANSETIFSIGIGIANTGRKNAVEVTADGYVYITKVGGYHGDESGQNVQTSISLLSYLASLELRILTLELQLNNL